MPLFLMLITHGLPSVKIKLVPIPNKNGFEEPLIIASSNPAIAEARCEADSCGRWFTLSLSQSTCAQRPVLLKNKSLSSLWDRECWALTP